MSLKRKTQELVERREQVLQGGGETAIKKQQAMGKMTARERVIGLLDDDSFQEYDLFAQHEGRDFDMEKKEEPFQTKIFAVKTTTGQERNVARLLAAKIEMEKIPIKSILVPDTLKGYVFIEADGPHLVEEAISGVRHVRSRIPGLVSFNEIERYIVRKPVIEDLGEDDVVEITGGPFKGMRAKITRIDKSKGEVTLELLEATFTLPITVHSDYVKLVEKGSRSEE